MDHDPKDPSQPDDTNLARAGCSLILIWALFAVAAYGAYVAYDAVFGG
jgi:hypothetical protein